MSLLLAVASPASAQNRRVSRGHQMVVSPGARAAGVRETEVSLPERGNLASPENRGSMTSRSTEALLGLDPLPFMGSMYNEVTQTERLTPNSVIRNLPSIESRLGGDDENNNETIFGRDERTRITGTTAVPWRWECQLIITMPDGKQYIGTGWLAGPRLVMTAGHCVHDGGSGKQWASKIEVIPAMNGSRRPYGTYVSRSFISVNGWTRNRNFDYDYGCILLPSNVGNSLGYMGFANYNDSTLRSITLNTAGYPGDKPFGTQWFTTGRVNNLSSRQIYTFMDIKGGQSGSPVWRLTNGQRYAVAIVSAENSQTNFLLRINSEVFANIRNWKTR